MSNSKFQLSNWISWLSYVVNYLPDNSHRSTDLSTVIEQSINQNRDPFNLRSVERDQCVNLKNEAVCKNSHILYLHN